VTKKAAAGLELRTGTGRFIHGVPRRDLTAEDLARLVYRDAGRLRPGDKGFAEALAKRRESLIRSGLYLEPAGASAEPVTTAPDPAETTSAPAETAAPDGAPENEPTQSHDETAAPAAEES